MVGGVLDPDDDAADHERAERARLRGRFCELVLWAPNLTHLDKLVAIAIAGYLNLETGACFPSQKLLAKQLGVSTRAIAASVSRLKNCRWIDARRGDRTKSNRYLLLQTHILDMEDWRRENKETLRRDVKRISHQKRPEMKRLSSSEMKEASS